MSAKIRVYHATYGCGTGCCGHVVEWPGGERFDFGHPSRESAREFAYDIISANAPECLATLDWDSVEIDTDDVRQDC